MAEADMAELLLELFCEEIPARMQRRAADDLARLMGEGLTAAGLTFDSARSFVTPRRLTLVMQGLPLRSPDIEEERKGPRVGAPDKAVQGFLRATGLSSLEEAEIVTDAKRGDYYLARIRTPGRPTPAVIAELVPDIVRRFPWPKSMRWGSGRLRWVRPLHAILCLFDGEVVPFAVDGIASGNVTRGHRFMAPQSFAVTGFADYVDRLREAKVALDPEARRSAILDGARRLAGNRWELIEDESLLEENAGLTEWPVPLLGSFDAAFLDVPPEVLSTAMKAHQKCFSLRERGDGGRLANRFVLVANLEAKDGGRAIVAGNERVIRARLADAKFFWDQDRKVHLQDRVEKLKDIVFHDRLGSQYDRVQRLRRLARELAPVVGAQADDAERAAILAKADLVTAMVGEFPELQGIMGRYYALHEGEQPEVASAIAEHYKPQGPADAVPTQPVAMAAALADKIDMLVGFWTIAEKPTGSRDPYGLRRAALGVIRIVLENALRLPLVSLFESHAPRVEDSLVGAEATPRQFVSWRGGRARQTSVDLLAFFADRLKVHLREQGARHDLIDAVYSLGDQDDLLLIVRRVEALGRFLDSEDGKNLLIGVERALSILRIEEKKDARRFDGAPDPALFEKDEEKALAAAIEQAAAEAGSAVSAEDFEAAMRAMAALRAPVDAFFDHVTVNAEQPALRENRLKLLNRIRAATLAVADFSRIEG